MTEGFTYDPVSGHVLRGGKRVGWQNPDGYRYVQCGAKQVKEHRLIWFLVHGAWPSEQLDHINGNKRDNRLTNLRPASGSVNQHNTRRRCDNSSGYKGVRYHAASGAFQARIGLHGRQHHLGTFPTAYEAHLAYERAANERARTLGIAS